MSSCDPLKKRKTVPSSKDTIDSLYVYSDYDGIPDGPDEDPNILNAFSIDGSKLDYAELKFDSTDLIVKPQAVPTSRKELKNMIVVTKKIDRNKSAGVNVPGFGGLKLENSDSNVNAYYIETKVVYGKVFAVGYSVHYLFKKVKKGISLSNLPLVSASVTLDGGKTDVYYSIRSYGMIGLPLTKYFKPVLNKPFDVE